MPVIEVRTPGEDEYELPSIRVPGTANGVAHDFTDLGKSRGSQGLRYIGALITNASGFDGFLTDSHGRVFDVNNNQVGEWDLEEGSEFLSWTPNGGATSDGGVKIVLRLKRFG